MKAPQRSMFLLMAMLLLGGVLLGQPSTQPFELLEGRRDSNDVLFLLQESVKTEGERATNLAEQAVYISRLIDFDRGADLGFGHVGFPLFSH